MESSVWNQKPQECGAIFSEPFCFLTECGDIQNRTLVLWGVKKEFNELYQTLSDYWICPCES